MDWQAESRVPAPSLLILKPLPRTGLFHKGKNQLICGHTIVVNSISFQRKWPEFLVLLLWPKRDGAKESFRFEFRPISVHSSPFWLVAQFSYFFKIFSQYQYPETCIISIFFIFLFFTHVYIF